MATISKLVVSLEANSAKLVKTLTSSRKRFKKWAKSAVSNVKSVAKAFSVISIGAVAGFIVALNKSAAAIDNITKSASKLGFPIEDYQKFAHIAALSNVSMEQFGKGMQKMLRTVGDARDGLSTATKAFDSLGLSWDELAQMSPTKQLELIGAAMKDLPTQADKVKVAMDIFGRSGVDLLNVFESDIKSISKEFDDLGITITASQAKSVAAFQDSKTKIGALVGGIADNVTATLAPALTMLVDKSKEWIKEFGGGKKLAFAVAKAIVKGMAAAVKSFGSVLNAIDNVRAAMTNLQALWLSIKDLFASGLESEKLIAEIGELAQQKAEIEIGIKNRDKTQAKLDEFANEMLGTLDDKLGNVDVGVNMAGKVGIAGVDKLVKANNDAAVAAKSFADILKDVSGSSVWQDIFKKEKVTARSAQFDDVARRLREGIEKGSSFTAGHLAHLTQIVQTAKKNQQVFTSEGTFGQVDINGMTEVLLGLTQLLDAKSEGSPLAVAAEKIASSNNETGEKFNQLINNLNSTPQLANVELAFTTDTGRVAGKIFAEPAFISNLKTFHDNQQREGTRADSA